MVIVSINVIGQNLEFKFGPWQNYSLNGKLQTEGFYRMQEKLTNDYKDDQTNYFMTGGVELNNRSSIWHPNFLMLNVKMKYYPGVHNKTFIVFPDQSEVRTRQEFGVTGLLFKDKAVKGNFFFNLHGGLRNLDNLNSRQFNNKNYGFGVTSYKFINTNFTIERKEEERYEKFSDRHSVMERNKLNLKLEKVFNNRNRNLFNYSFSDNTRNEIGFYKTNIQHHKIGFTNSYYLDERKNYHLMSNISDQNQNGTYSYNRFSVRENIILKLPYNFEVNSSYSYINNKRQEGIQSTNNANAELKHKLYLSLISRLKLEYFSTKSNEFKENKIGSRIGFLYTKKIPKGRLNINYTYGLSKRQKTSESTIITVVDEEYRLTDGEIVLLNRPHINANSIVVSDNTGSVIYQQNLDYVLIEVGNYVEIQRVSGGQIENNSLVFVDYASMQTGSFSYNEELNSLYSSVQFFDRLMELYFKLLDRDYFNLDQTDFVSLHYLNSKIFGLKTSYKYIRAGIEYTNNYSSISSYKMKRFFINGQYSFSRYRFSLNANYSDYSFYEQSLNERQYIDLSGKSAIRLHPSTYLNVDIGLRKHRGNSIFLDLATFRSEIQVNLRKLYFRVGVELYKRTQLNDSFGFQGVYFDLARKF